MKRSHSVYDLVKRIADIIVSAVVLVILSPVYAIVAALVLLRLGSPVLFRQPRPGKRGRTFTLYKFRTMGAAPAEKTGESAVASDSERLTPLGRTLRALSLDELPEFFNILKGDMSMVGPRPLLPEYLDRYNEHQARRHEVRPGLTGWAQVNGRNAVPWPERFDMDVWYVDNRSLLLDLRILFMTVAAVVKREGVSGEGSETMEPFRGNDGGTPGTRER